MNDKALKVLAVDDHDGMRQAVAEAMRSLGYPCDVASCAKECLDKLMSRHFDVVLLDLVLPDIDGATLLPVLKQQFPHTRIAILSFLDDDGMIREVLSKGASAYLVKPVTPEALKQVMTKLETEMAPEPKLPNSA